MCIHARMYHTYMHTYLRTYVLTYIHTYIQWHNTYIDIRTLTYIHIHAKMHTCVHAYMHAGMQARLRILQKTFVLGLSSFNYSLLPVSVLLMCDQLKRHVCECVQWTFGGRTVTAWTSLNQTWALHTKLLTLVQGCQLVSNQPYTTSNLSNGEALRQYVRI